MSTEIICIVEGDGDVEALPILIRRIASERLGVPCAVPRPIRIRRDSFVRDDNYRAQYLQLARAKAAVSNGVILILFDADRDCPVDLRASLLHLIAAVTHPIRTALVVAKTEFEAWFVGAAESIRGQRGIGPDASSPPDPESIANPKGWLRERMPRIRTYSETVDQPALAALFDWQRARQRCGSLDKLCRDLEMLLS